MKKIRTLAVYADIHAGSTAGLLPPGFTNHEGNQIELNAIQQWLWTCWEDQERWLADLIGRDSYGIIWNGDLIEGIHHGTKQIISPEVADHLAAAMQVIGPAAKRATKNYFVRGTECHTGHHEAAIARQLGGEIIPETGQPWCDRLTLDIAGLRLVARHHVPATIRPYLESGQYSMTLASEQAEATRNGEPAPRILCCAHRHRYGRYDDGFGLMVVSPPWQALTRHGHKIVSHARTRPGLYVLDWRGLPDGELPVVHRRLYDAPKPKSARI